jgi:hypothetical protein
VLAWSNSLAAASSDTPECIAGIYRRFR